MAAIRSYTTVEQSRKLAKILPLESADMYWWSSGKEYYIEAIDDGDFIENRDIRAWSLAALLEVMPEIQGGKPIIALDDNYITYPHMRGLHTKAESLVDACVAMIEKLNEQNLL